MEQKIIKPIIRVGNSAGVLVPKDWINGSARVELIAKPMNINKDILEILEPYLVDILGIYLIGSYARGEQTEKSDVDVLAVTNRKSDRIKKGKYDILLITKKDINEALKNNALPILPMLKEAKTIINEEYVKSIKKSPLSKKNLRWHMDFIKSALKINKGLIELKKEHSKSVADSISYSLILNLRSTYIIDCIKKKQKWSTAGLLSLIKKISGSLEAYEGYLRIKKDGKTKETLSIKEAEKLLDYTSKKLKEQEKWIKRKG